MSGAFGLHDDRHHTRVPLDRLVESRPRLDVFMLHRIGALVEGAVTELRWGGKGYQLARHTESFGQQKSGDGSVESAAAGR